MKNKNETQIQADAYLHLYNKHPMLRLCLFSVPNEALFSNLQHLDQGQKMALIGRFKASGLTPGVNDMIFYWQKVTYWLELKDDTGVVSPEQKFFHRNLEIHGFDVNVYRTTEEVIAKVEAIMLTHPLSDEQKKLKTDLLHDMLEHTRKKKSRKY